MPYHPMTKEKESLKKIADKITELKTLRAEALTNDISSLQKKISLLKTTYRHRHMAYCLVRGKTIMQIERKAKKKIKMDIVNFYRMNLLSAINKYYHDFVDELLLEKKKPENIIESKCLCDSCTDTLDCKCRVCTVYSECTKSCKWLSYK